MRRVVAIDVDGVLADFSGGWQGIQHFGEPIKGAVEFTRKISEFADILIWTTRVSDDIEPKMAIFLKRNIVRNWLDAHGFVYHDIWTGAGKPLFAAVIDDRAVSCEPQVALAEFGDAILEAKRLCGVEVSDASE